MFLTGFFAHHQRLENASFGIQWPVIMDVMASKCVKKEIINFRAPFLDQECLCVSFLRSDYLQLQWRHVILLCMSYSFKTQNAGLRRSFV